MHLQSWARQQIFQWIHGNNLVYNQCWEDPRLDRQAFQIQPSDNVLVITSAGCNALEYLLDSPKHIDAVDMNPRQNALLELKKAGIKTLDYEDFFTLFGLGMHPGIDRLYRKHLRLQLPDFARLYWDRHIDFFKTSTFHKGFYYRGSSGLIARLIGHYISIKGLLPVIDQVFSAKNLQEQAFLYYSELKPYFWNDLLRWTTRRAALMSSLGVPRSQFLQIESSYVGGMAKFIEDCLDFVFSKISLSDNYFYHLYLFGYYSHNCCPEYLKECHFETLKERVDRLKTHNLSLLEFFKKDTKQLHKITLLDHMDWLYENHRSLLQTQWEHLLRKTNENSKIIWRSASPTVDFIDPLPIENNKTMGDMLVYESDLASSLHKKDRVHTYGSFYIAGVRS